MVLVAAEDKPQGSSVAGEDMGQFRTCPSGFSPAGLRGGAVLRRDVMKENSARPVRDRGQLDRGAVGVAGDEGAVHVGVAAVHGDRVGAQVVEPASVGMGVTAVPPVVVARAEEKRGRKVAGPLFHEPGLDAERGTVRSEHVQEISGDADGIVLVRFVPGPLVPGEPEAPWRSSAGS